MKKLISILIGTIAVLIVVVGNLGSIIWAAASFIVYLAKDVPFQWWSIYSLLISITFTILIYVIMEHKKAEYKAKNPPIKSNFQKRLEEMAEKRKQAQNN